MTDRVAHAVANRAAPAAADDLVAATDWSAAQVEAVDLLSRLIRIDTTNPPGNESRLTEFLADELATLGFDVRLYGAAPGRANLVARWCGVGEKPPLLLLGHADVVYADGAAWSQPPFGGVVSGGYVWGRGAVDMKGLLAMQVMALKLLARAGVRLSRDIILLTAADEEDSGRYGAGWLVDNHWDAIAAEYAFGEGGVGLSLNGRPTFLVATSEKGYSDLLLRAHGTASHASTPIGQSALLMIAEALQRIARYRPNVIITEPVWEHLRVMGPMLPWRYRLAARAHSFPSIAAGLLSDGAFPTLGHALRNTLTPTMVHGGRQPNVVPETADLTLNCRTLPGVTVDDLLVEVRKAVGGMPLEVSVQQFNPASVSPSDTPFFAAIAGAIQEDMPDAVVAPYMMPGATDARFFRARGVTAYGLMPVGLSPEEMVTIHGADERLAVERLGQGTRIMLRLLSAMGR
ncbi:MAG: M20/M25/M40 family metallo-hydrolase [Anaerolineae bacterium]